ncbi:MAG: hypothetical protein MMC33_000940 [Icmadophila ericetorum]|nr:hypothetical protein [Icmadophila ericetorum]
MSTPAAIVDALDYVRSRSQVDVDSLDVQVSIEYGPFSDCTSNQIDAYYTLCKPEHSPLLKRATVLSQQFKAEYPSVTREELTFEIASILVGFLVVPKITGHLLIMANPLYSYSTAKIIETGQRIAQLCKRLDSHFDLSRLCIKVPATWEGLQACRKLKDMGIATLATTMFCMEQAVLAAEVGCIYMSPFCHELKAILDSTYQDTDTAFGLCVQAQRYFEQYGYSARVKAAGMISAAEVLKLTGVAAMTVAPDILQELRSLKNTKAELDSQSLFQDELSMKKDYPIMERESFADDEVSYRTAFSLRNEGKGHLKTIQAINIFCDFQRNAEVMIKALDSATVENVPATIDHKVSNTVIHSEQVTA